MSSNDNSKDGVCNTSIGTHQEASSEARRTTEPQHATRRHGKPPSAHGEFPNHQTKCLENAGGVVVKPLERITRACVFCLSWRLSSSLSTTLALP